MVSRRGFYGGYLILFFPVVSGSAAIISQKKPGVIAEMVETAGGGYLGNAHGSVFQEPPAHFQSITVQEINGRLAHVAFKQGAAFTSAHTAGGSDRGQTQFFRIMPVDKGHHVLLDGKVIGRYLSGRARKPYRTGEQSAPKSVNESDNFQFISCTPLLF